MQKQRLILLPRYHMKVLTGINKRTAASQIKNIHSAAVPKLWLAKASIIVYNQLRSNRKIFACPMIAKKLIFSGKQRNGYPLLA